MIFFANFYGARISECGISKEREVREQERIISTALSQKYAALWLFLMVWWTNSVPEWSGELAWRSGDDFSKMEQKGSCSRLQLVK